MMPLQSPRLCQLFVFLAALFPVCQLASAEPEVDYAKDIYPILETHCLGCHNSDEADGELVMDDFAAMMRGGEKGVALTAGEPNSSRMFLMVSGKMDPVMPPEDAEGLSDEELKLMATWIEQGAKGPSGPMPIKRSLRTPIIKANQQVAQPITAATLSTGGDLVAVARFATVHVMQGDVESSIRLNADDKGKINSLQFSPDSKTLLMGSGLTGVYGRAAIYDWKSGQLVQEFTVGGDTLYDAVFSPDGNTVAAAGYDAVIRLWDVASGKQLGELKGHNGAIYDLEYSPDGAVLISASADETVKVWNPQTMQRLDTLSQPEGEVLVTKVTKDGAHILAGSADNRIRIWQLKSKTTPAINPLVAARFVDESPAVAMDFTPDGRQLLAVFESGNAKVLSTVDWQPVASLDRLPDSATSVMIRPDGGTASAALMNGQLATITLPTASAGPDDKPKQQIAKVYLPSSEPLSMSEAEARQAATKQPVESARGSIPLPGHSLVNGQLSDRGEVDWYQWDCHQGEVWAIDVDKASGSKLDPIVTITDVAGKPVIQVRLQAIRDSYFTFRGKNSDQTDDFRLFNWQELQLNQYLYSAGEVTRLKLHPRGPDSGFNVYPGRGKRWTYFGTSGATHALGEPAYIVQPMAPGSEPMANGLPTFDVPYQNDDDPMRMAGTNSRLLFTAPSDGPYRIAVRDTRGEGGEKYGYQLRVRPAEPKFNPKVSALSKELFPGTGREIGVSVDRFDGFDGPVTFEIDALPDGLISNFPVTIESGQQSAQAVVWATPEADAKLLSTEAAATAKVTAWAMINGQRIEKSVGDLGKLVVSANAPKVSATIARTSDPADQNVARDLLIQIPRGQTVSARVVIQRAEGFNGQVSFGKEFSGRNPSHGVYVDNIGLNGLLIVANASEREFFLTADPTATPGKRAFFLTAAVDGGLATHPVTVEVLP
ncbi:c-type cytochrome domain-containing protein [Stieleria bergensis]